MAITYPITLSSTLDPSEIIIESTSIVAMVASIYTGKQEVQAQQGDYWEATIKLPQMIRAEAEEWIADLLSLKGMLGTFWLPVYEGKTPRGSVAGTPQVDGAGQTGETLNTKLWTPSTANVLMKGDYIQLDNHFYKCLTNVDSDAGGLAVVELNHRLRVSPSDSTSLITSNCKGLFRLKDNTTKFTVGAFTMYKGFSFSAIEAI